VLFFAPAQIKKRSARMGCRRFSANACLNAWREFIGTVCRPAEPWLVIEHHRGPEAVAKAYAVVLSGRDEPRRGRMLALAEASE
jgi:hypothetical protein